MSKGNCGTKSPAASLLQGKQHSVTGIPKQMGSRPSESKSQASDHSESEREHNRTEQY